MKNKKIFFTTLFITCGIALASCGGEIPSLSTSSEVSTTIVETTTTVDNTTTKEGTTTSTKEVEPEKPEIVEGDKYSFGSYPQTKVEASLENGLASIEFNASTWKDYGYYAEDELLSYMYYYDVDTNNDGAYDYRGVYFTSYRPQNVSLPNYEYNSDQMYNGYFNNRIHWFKYEPIQWTVLKVNNGKALLFSDLILDSQDYHHLTSSKEISGETVYSNNYQYSYLRGWLNDAFYATAYNSVEKNKVLTTNVDNSPASTGYDYNDYSCANTSDKIFLLSKKEIVTNYEDNSSRISIGTDYAIAQGLFVTSYGDNDKYSCYWLRSPANDYDFFSYLVDGNGNVNDGSVNVVHFGVRPSCWIEL